MWSYLERSLEAERLAEFEAHLDTCVRCCGELEFSRSLRQLVATSQEPPAMPPEVRSRIDRILLLDTDGTAEDAR
jgi:hypothetical protein